MPAPLRHVFTEDELLNSPDLARDVPLKAAVPTSAPFNVFDRAALGRAFSHAPQRYAYLKDVSPPADFDVFFSKHSLVPPGWMLAAPGSDHNLEGIWIFVGPNFTPPLYRP